MSIQMSNKGFKKSSGFTIVEFMIAGTLGLFLIAGVIQLFLGSSQNYRVQDDLAVIQEDGRLALMYMKEQIQRGSWTPDYLNIPPAIDFTQSLDSATDTVAIQYNMNVDGGVTNVDCNGSEVLSGQIINTFLINASEELACRGNGGGGSQPLIANVADFQVLYGVDTISAGGCPSGKVARYLNATDVLAEGLGDQVMSVRLAILLKSDSDVLPEDDAKSFQVMDTQVDVNDKLIRRVFQQTIFMPNAVLATAGNPQSAIDCL
ncbi:MAG: type IV pilus assembly protein PilW [Polaribacter sp.]|jgi:type IV pilus assembly protein PilW